MEAPKRVLCIMDMSAVGRSSLAVVLPVLAACGAQGCPLPASLFSAHTGGFGQVEVLDTGRYAAAALGHYGREGILFDAVYIGYLRGADQFSAARLALDMYPGAMRVVDPAMGDGGRLYSGLTQDTVNNMRALCERASLVTPNLTESALLLGEDPDAPLRGGEVSRRLEALAGERRGAVITGVPGPGEGMLVAGKGAGGQPLWQAAVELLPGEFPGTGDLYTSALTGLLLRGMTLESAARAAAAFVSAALRRTVEGGGERRHGVWFESCLPLLGSA